MCAWQQPVSKLETYTATPLVPRNMGGQTGAQATLFTLFGNTATHN
jgi:hypothetical protein